MAINEQKELYGMDEERVPIEFSSEPTKVLDKGLVSLAEVMPSMAPKGRTVEYVIVRSARISYGQELGTDLKRDKELIKYLYRNLHTSVFEGISFTFFLRIPNHIATHLIRHRTAKLNVLSQRYTDMSEAGYYNPRDFVEAMRAKPPPGKSKQGSTLEMNDAKRRKLDELVEKSEAVVEQVFSLYREMIEAGVAKECARSILPQGTYVDMYYTMDLNNLLKFFNLRMDENAQYETRVYARAMYDLVKPLIPTVAEVFEDYTLNGVSVSGTQARILRHDLDFEEGKTQMSKGEIAEFNQKRLLITLQI